MMIILCKKERENECLGLSCLQKVTAAFMVLSQGVPEDFMDNYIKIGESTAIGRRSSIPNPIQYCG
jgi:hypothetical protein